KGPEALAATLAQLEGFEAAAAAWEGEILPARLGDYDPVWLDALCLAGRVVWGRLAPAQTPEGRRSGPVRGAPLAPRRPGAGRLARDLARPPGDVGRRARAVRRRAGRPRLPAPARRLVLRRGRRQHRPPQHAGRRGALRAGGLGAGDRRQLHRPARS